MTQDRPEAPDLLDAVASYLFTEVRGAVPREQRFRVLVAANVCAVAAREWRAGKEPLRQDLALFRGLLGQDPTAETAESDLRDTVRSVEAELCDVLRCGGIDDRLEEVAVALQAHVRRKLEVARPGYDRRD